LDVFLVLDRSGSMAGRKWAAARDGIGDFAKSKASGIEVGLTFFPPPAPIDISSDEYCRWGDVHRYHPDVALGPLPQNEAALALAFASTEPVGSTPLYPALYGTLGLATERKTAFPSHIVVVVVATDGLPTVCELDPNEFAKIVTSARDYNGV